MEFIKHNFKVGDRVTVAQLNEIEDGIIEAAQSGGSAEAAVEEILNGATQLTNFKAVENTFDSMGQAFSKMAQDVSQQGAEISTVEHNVESLATHVDDELDDLEGTLQTQINVNKNGIDLVMEELGLTIDPKQDFPGADGESKISLLETGLNLVGTKTEAHEFLLDNILDDLGLTELTETDFPIDGERTSTRALAQYSNDAVNIVLHELGLDEAAEEEYPTQNTKSIRELIDSKIELIKLDINGSYDQEALKQIYDAVMTNNATIRLLVGNSNGYRYLDVVSLIQEPTEQGKKLIGNTIDKAYQVIIEDDDGEYSIEFIKPAVIA